MAFGGAFRVGSAMRSSIAFACPPCSFSCIVAVGVGGSVTGVGAVAISGPLRSFFVVRGGDRFSLGCGSRVVGS